MGEADRPGLSIGTGAQEMKGQFRFEGRLIPYWLHQLDPQLAHVYEEWLREKLPRINRLLKTDPDLGYDKKNRMMKPEIAIENFWFEHEAFIRNELEKLVPHTPDENPKKRREVIEQALGVEKNFVREVFMAYSRWIKEDPRPLVLWDIDDTMGKAYGSEKWKTRPCLPLLLEDLEQFYPLEMGIDSDRTVRETQFCLGMEIGELTTEEQERFKFLTHGEMGEIQKYLTSDQIYCSRLEEAAKLDERIDLLKIPQEYYEKYSLGSIDKIRIILWLTQQGKNVKAIDDMDFAKIKPQDNVFVDRETMMPRFLY
ncbi:MAG: hypothetical protein ACD_28C00198G0003 [uncultured bacterium]|nr:MAG: hypothetical protein ACD_28C00198G0003 [uncultured bacterium]